MKHILFVKIEKTARSYAKLNATKLRGNAGKHTPKQYNTTNRDDVVKGGV